MKVDDYSLLVTLHETKTLRKSAEKLYISQPAVSQRLRSIENEWGVQIFVRTKRELYVTGEGEKIIEHAKNVVEREKMVKDFIAANQNAIQGNISIGVSSLIGHTILPEVLAQYTHLYPDVNINLKVGSSEQLINDSDKYHLTIVRGNQILNKENELLFMDKHYLVTPKTEKDLSRLPVIEFLSDPMYLKQMERYFEARFQTKYNPQIRVDQIAACRALLLQGVGITVLPELVAKGFDDEAFNTEEVAVDGESITRATYISYDKNVLELPQVRAFITLLRTLSAAH